MSRLSALMGTGDCSSCCTALQPHSLPPSTPHPNCGAAISIGRLYLQYHHKHCCGASYPVDCSPKVRTHRPPQERRCTTQELAPSTASHGATAIAPMTEVAAPVDPQAVSLQGLNFAYPGCPPSLKDVNLDLPKGSRCLLIGANGAGELYDRSLEGWGYWRPRRRAALPRGPPVWPPSAWLRSACCMAVWRQIASDDTSIRHALNPPSKLQRIYSTTQARPPCCSCWPASTWWGAARSPSWAAPPFTTCN
jgi:hypothetical protein